MHPIFVETDGRERGEATRVSQNAITKLTATTTVLYND